MVGVGRYEPAKLLADWLCHIIASPCGIGIFGGEGGGEASPDASHELPTSLVIVRSPKSPPVGRVGFTDPATKFPEV